jgi:hypothetical protein
VAPSPSSNQEFSPDANHEKIKRLIDWNVQVLSSLLRCVLARRQAVSKKNQGASTQTAVAPMMPGGMVLDEVKEVISLPPFNADTLNRQVDPEKVELDPEVVEQLHGLVTWIASMYRYVAALNAGCHGSSVGLISPFLSTGRFNPFHNFGANFPYFR